jgi:pimeloyl-ACP methyl ester carboxylesterase
MSETIVLVHGLWMTGIELAVLQRRLETDYGYECAVFSYRSVTAPLQNHIDGLHSFIQRLNTDLMHLVCHSLGGVIAYRMLESATDLPPGRAVFMGSPLQGSAAAHVLARYALGRMVIGHAAREALLEPRLQSWDGRRDIGIIAGSSHLGLGRLISPELGEDSDGTVRIAETLLEGARDHITLPVTHTGMVLSRAVAMQAVHFLRTGRFDHSQAKASA